MHEKQPRRLQICHQRDSRGSTVQQSSPSCLQDEWSFSTISDRDPSSHPFSGWTWRKCYSANGPQAVSPMFNRICFVSSASGASVAPLLSVRSCRCARAIDFFGHHSATCSGNSGRHHTIMRDMDLAVRATDDKRPEVVVDGLPLFGESQLARPSCVRYIVRQFSTPWGVVLETARWRKERRYPELVGPRLVVLGSWGQAVN